jgi:hypothetical protein
MPLHRSLFTISEAVYAYLKLEQLYLKSNDYAPFYDCRGNFLHQLFGITHFHRMQLPQLLHDIIVPDEVRRPSHTKVEIEYIDHCLTQFRMALVPFHSAPGLLRPHITNPSSKINPSKVTFKTPTPHKTFMTHSCFSFPCRKI